MKLSGFVCSTPGRGGLCAAGDTARLLPGGLQLPEEPAGTPGGIQQGLLSPCCLLRTTQRFSISNINMFY